MNAVVLMLATAVLGVDYGWHRLPNGEWEYIIQVEPALVETLTNGQALVSQMPQELQGVRRFRVQVGDGELPREPLPTMPIGAGVPTTQFGRASGSLDARRPNSGGVPGAGWGTPWPLGVDPRELASLRSYEWVSLDPIDLQPIENHFYRELGGDDESRRDDRVWDRFTTPASGVASRWNGATSRAPNTRRNDQFNSLPDRDVERLDLNDEPGGGNWHLNSNWTANNPLEGPKAPTGRLASQSTQRGVLGDRKSRTGSGTTLGTPTSIGGGGLRAPSVADDASPTMPRGTNPGPRGSLSADTMKDRAWWPLTMTLLVLFASLGGNLYLGWLAVDFYRRYREAAWELRTSDSPAR